MTRRSASLLSTLIAASLVLACSDDSSNAESQSSTETGTETGDGDGDPATASGDGDGDTSGDGDGDTTGDGDGDTSGDGDGDTGDGDGDTAGDGDGDQDPEGMVGNGEFWIDANEATVMDYALFLPQSSLDNLPPACAWKQTHQPQGWNSQLRGDFGDPVHGVDWCDAWAFCDYHGKRLCGMIGGAPAGIGDKDDTANNEWMKACTNGDPANDYPYGPDYQTDACNTVDAGLDALANPGSFAGCEGGFAGLFDMSGNVWEWTSACAEEDVQDQLQSCRRRGGSFQSAADVSRCGVGSTRAREFQADNTGIRCCMNL